MQNDLSHTAIMFAIASGLGSILFTILFAWAIGLNRKQNNMEKSEQNVKTEIALLKLEMKHLRDQIGQVIQITKEVRLLLETHITNDKKGE